MLLTGCHLVLEDIWIRIQLLQQLDSDAQ